MLNVLRPLTWWFAVAGSAIALAVGVMTAVSVVGRAFFKSPIQGDIQLTQLGSGEYERVFILPDALWRGVEG